MDAILWAIAIPILLIVGVLCLMIGWFVLAIILAIAIPLGFIGAGISVGGFMGGVLIIVGIMIGIAFYNA